MATAKLYDFSGTYKGTLDLPEALFGVPVNKAVLYDAVRQFLANQRTGTAKTKERSEVNYSTKKPWRQKGTGRARAHSVAAGCASSDGYSWRAPCRLP